jgi:hypothetical protein
VEDAEFNPYPANPARTARTQGIPQRSHHRQALRPVAQVRTAFRRQRGLAVPVPANSVAAADEPGMGKLKPVGSMRQSSSM